MIIKQEGSTAQRHSIEGAVVLYSPVCLPQFCLGGPLKKIERHRLCCPCSPGMQNSIQQRLWLMLWHFVRINIFLVSGSCYLWCHITTLELREGRTKMKPRHPTLHCVGCCTAPVPHDCRSIEEEAQSFSTNKGICYFDWCSYSKSRFSQAATSKQGRRISMLGSIRQNAQELNGSKELLMVFLSVFCEGAFHFRFHRCMASERRK